ncbi:hypothetical protein LOD99_14751 [Oopsacas minuta]|uniref:Uncharacterized protein n=1 Tax=Oopsacas minuta TaxID=111878 RepID=A0AAV7KDZ5_9METZ|nr:hypothetical protein LOD99_14751 [Oopsacas minuta]
MMIKFLDKTTFQTKLAHFFYKLFYANTINKQNGSLLPPPLFYYLYKPIKKQATSTRNVVLNIPQATVERLTEELSKAPVSDKKYIQKMKYGSERIDPFAFHALSHSLFGFYSATLPNISNRMRMVFTFNVQEGSLKFCAILPSHEYEVFHKISLRAKNLNEVYEYFEKYNLYRFNQTLSPEEQYRHLIKMCTRKKFSESIIEYMKNDEDFIKLMQTKL